jgi:hypothetical protein
LRSRPDVSQASSSAAGNGSGRSSSAFTTLNTVVFAAIPSAMMTIVTSAKPGSLDSVRMA